MPEVSGGQPKGLPGVVPEIILKVPPYCCLAAAVDVTGAVVVGFIVADGDILVDEGWDVGVAVAEGAVEVAGVVDVVWVAGAVVVFEAVLQPTTIIAQINRANITNKDLFNFPPHSL